MPYTSAHSLNQLSCCEGQRERAEARSYLVTPGLSAAAGRMHVWLERKAH